MNQQVGRMFKFARMGLLVTLLFSMASCGGFKVVRIPIPIPTFGIGGEKKGAPDKSSPDYQPTDITVSPETGLASWYGRKFHGRRTASGEKYNMYALTAAHPSLPFGTRVKITNLENGKTIRVTINDRGPFVHGRIIDVSYAAAKELGFDRQGVAQVRLESSRA